MYTDAKLVLSQQTTAASNGPTDTRAKKRGNRHLFPESSSAPTNGNPIRQMSNLLTHNTFTANTTCCVLCWTSPSSSAFHTGTWTFSILPNVGASRCEQVLLFKLSAPLDPFIQINPTQSYSCLSPPACIFLSSQIRVPLWLTSVTHRLSLLLLAPLWASSITIFLILLHTHSPGLRCTTTCQVSTGLISQLKTQTEKKAYWLVQTWGKERLKSTIS